MKSSWIFQLGSKSNHKCPYQRRRHEEGGRDVATAKEHLEHQVEEEGHEFPLIVASRRNTALPDFGL